MIHARVLDGIRPLVAVVLVLISTAIYGQDWRLRTQLPGVDMGGLNQRQQSMVLQILREEDCPCGCNMKLAQCRVEDQTCPMSPKLVKQVTDAARQQHSSMVIRSSLVSQLTSKDMLNRQISFEAIRRSVSVDPPRVRFEPPGRNGNVYWYEFGPSDGQSREVPRYSDLTSFPIELQRTVESIRKVRPIAFWNPHFVRVENIVRQQVDMLNNPRGMSGNQLEQEMHASSVRGYQILDGAIQGFARSKGWTARMSMSAEAVRGSGHVMIAVNPAGATVYFSSEDKFRETVKLGLRAIRNVNANWQPLGQISGAERFDIPASGKTRFYALWPNGMEEMTLVNVKESVSEDNVVVTPVRIQGF